MDRVSGTIVNSPRQKYGLERGNNLSKVLQKICGLGIDTNLVQLDRPVGAASERILGEKERQGKAEIPRCSSS